MSAMFEPARRARLPLHELTRRSAVWAALAWMAAAGDPSRVPTPAETPAQLIVSGRTSTAVDIRIVKVGQRIPRTHAGPRIANSAGFEWYVSQHYALKSEMDEEFSRRVLEISELALPHWRALTGLEPPDSDTTRMAIVYAKSLDSMRQATADDVGSPWRGQGGGVTLWNNSTAYNYPSGTLQYHLRDLVIHENLHMLQGVATRNSSLRWTMGEESFVHAAAQHVYDPARKQLTVMVFDQAPINHPTAEGIASLQQELKPLDEMIADHWRSSGSLGATYTHFFWSDPERWFRWCLWRDELYRGRVTQETNRQVLEGIFGPLEELGRAWEEWVRERRISFRHVDWGWEQDGDELMAYGWPWQKEYWSQMDLQYAPGEPARHDPLRMDYPAHPMPPIVGPVERGTREPSVGYVADLSGGGWIGLGLGVDGRSMCQVLVTAGKLVVVGQDMEPARQEFPFTKAVATAGEQSGERYGVTIQVREHGLELTVRAQARTLARMQVAVPLDDATRQRILTRTMAVVAKDGRPRLTPFIDDARRPPPDLMQPAPANPWRFPAEQELLGVHRAAHRLGDLAPASLTALREAMLASVGGQPAEQRTALELYERSAEAVARDILEAAAAPLAHAAAADLLGFSLRAFIDDPTAERLALLTADLASRSAFRARGRIDLAAEPTGSLGTLPRGERVDVPARQSRRVSWRWRLPVDVPSPAMVRLTASMTCGGVELRWTEDVQLRP